MPVGKERLGLTCWFGKRHPCESQNQLPDPNQKETNKPTHQNQKEKRFPPVGPIPALAASRPNYPLEGDAFARAPRSDHWPPGRKRGDNWMMLPAVLSG